MHKKEEKRKKKKSEAYETFNTGRIYSMKTDGQPHTPGTDGSGGQRRAGKGSEKRNDIMVARGFTFCVCVCGRRGSRERGRRCLKLKAWLVESTFRSHFSLLHCDRSSVCLSFSFSLSL